MSFSDKELKRLKKFLTSAPPSLRALVVRLEAAEKVFYCLLEHKVFCLCYEDKLEAWKKAAGKRVRIEHED